MSKKSTTRQIYASPKLAKHIENHFPNQVLAPVFKPKFSNVKIREGNYAHLSEVGKLSQDDLELMMLKERQRW